VQLEHLVHSLKDRPMIEQEWIKEVGATVIDVTPEDE
jgi:hypothetical protein